MHTFAISVNRAIGHYKSLNSFFFVHQVAAVAKADALPLLEGLGAERVLVSL